MSTVRKNYTREFKLEAVQLCIDSDKSVEQIAADLGISSSSLNRWRRELASDPEQAFPGHGRRKAPVQEVEDLRKALRLAQQERDILKKALAIFTQGLK